MLEERRKLERFRVNEIISTVSDSRFTYDAQWMIFPIRDLK